MNEQDRIEQNRIEKCGERPKAMQLGGSMEETSQEWLDSSSEGTLGAAEAALLESRLAANGQLAAEQKGWLALHQMLGQDRLPVREGFTQRVMAALPEPAWLGSSSRRLYPALVAALLACTLGATLLLAGLAETPLVGTGLALADFLQTSLLAGAGLLAATWVGLGASLDKVFTLSGASLLAFALMVVCLNLLFVSLLRRRRVQPQAARSGEGG